MKKVPRCLLQLYTYLYAPKASSRKRIEEIMKVSHKEKREREKERTKKKKGRRKGEDEVFE